MTLAYFTSPTCAPCKAFGPLVTKFASDNGHELLKFDASNEDHMLMFQEHRVRGVPTVIIIDEEGTEYKRNIGPMNLEQLREFVDV